MKYKASGMIRLQLEEIGVRMTSKVLPYAEMAQYVKAGNFDVCFAQNNPGLDPDKASLFWHSDGALNFGSYENNEVDRLLHTGRTSDNPRERRSIYRKVHALIAQDYSAVFLFFQRYSVVSTSRLKGVPDIGMIDLFTSVEQWYLTRN